MTQRLVIAVNDAGRRVGEDHQNAKLTNAEVDRMLALREEGWSYRRLAMAFDVSRSQARNICKGRKRNQFPSAWKVIKTGDV